MTEAPALPFLGRVGSNRTVAGSARVSRSRGLDFEGVEAVEIVAPDLYSAALLVGYAAPSFVSEIVPGSAWIVRFEPSTPGDDWVVELLSLVERWLESVPLPCAQALRDERRYLIRASTQGAQISDLPNGISKPSGHMVGPLPRTGGRRLIDPLEATRTQRRPRQAAIQARVDTLARVGAASGCLGGGAEAEDSSAERDSAAHIDHLEVGQPGSGAALAHPGVVTQGFVQGR